MLEELIAERRDTLHQAWVERIVGEYPHETARFLHSQGDRFANPVGFAVTRGTAEILDGLASGAAITELRPGLDRILRIRAVQEFTPGRAVAFVLVLRELVRDQLGDRTEDPRVCDELRAFDGRVEELLLAAVDVYTACRDELHRIQVESIRNRSLKVMERLNEWRARRDGAGGGDDEAT
jgi:hypothetical protein